MARPLMYHIAERYRDQWLKPRDLNDLQQKRLRQTIGYAYRRVPYYHRLFRSLGVRPDDIRTIHDLTKIPILTKKDAKDSLKSLLARGVERKQVEWYRTSGTTASPISVAKDVEYKRIINALITRMKLAYSEKPWDKTMHITHPASTFRSGFRSQSLGVFRYMHTAFFRAVPLGRIDETEDVMRSIRDFRPRVLQSHEFNLRLLSHYADSLRDGQKPRVIHTGQGEVEDNWTRRLLEDAFECGVYAGYGSSEFSFHGFECRRQRGYHIHSDHILIEYLRDGEQVECGEAGEMVVTDLSNRAMSLIRYQLGDVGVPSCEPCPCGRGLPLLLSVEGRVEDFVVLPDSRILTPRQISSRLNAVRGVA
ncbi:MAG: phenylacetate--CoA ligase family protein, partial [Thermoplasmata archaeon]